MLTSIHSGNKNILPHFTYIRTSAPGASTTLHHNRQVPLTLFTMATIPTRSSFSSFVSTNPDRKQFNRIKKDDKPGDVWGTLDSNLPKPLDKRFVDVKKRLVTRENYAAVQDSWDRLLIALKDKATEIEAAGPDVSAQLIFVQDSRMTLSVRSHGRVLFHRIRRKIPQRCSKSH